jgi:hypothetical protein
MGLESGILEKPISDPDVEKAPDPGYESASLALDVTTSVAAS